MLNSRDKALYHRTAAIVKAVAHPLRLAIVDYLKDGEKCVQAVADHVGSERSNVSRHLAVMLRAGTVQCRKDGLMVYYSLRSPCVVNFMRCATQLLMRTTAEETRLLSRS